MSPLLRRLAAPIAVAALLGCSTTSPTGGLLSISAGDLASGVPQIGWSPAGGNMNFVSLTTDADRNTILWRVETVGADGLVQPLTYGVTPEGATQTGTVPTLTRGVQYRITVRRLDGLGGAGTFRLP